MPRRSPTRPPLPRGRLGSRLLRGAPVTAPTAVTLADSGQATDVIWRPLSVENTFEGGTDGTTITTGNSGGASGQPFDTATAGTGATLAFEADRPAHGTLGMLAATGVTAATATAGWDAATLPQSPEQWHRFYWELTAAPATTQRLARMAQNGTLAAAVRVNSARQLQIADAANAAQGTMTTAIGLNSRVRVEWRVFGHPTAGQIEVRLWLTPDSSGAADETLLASNLNTLGLVNDVQWGWLTSSANVPAAYFDDVVAANTGWPGPAAAATPKTLADSGAASDRIRVPPARFLTIAVSGLEFSPVVNEASTTLFSNLEFQVYDSDYHTESQASLNYLAGRGWPALKIPFRPERVTPVLSGAANATELGRLTTSLDRAATAGKLGILDRHSYGVYYRDGSETGQTAGTGFRQAIGSANYPTAAFVDSWVRIITALGSHSALWGICLENEPQGTGGLTRATWYSAAQQAVTALRNLGWAGWIQVNGWNWGDLFHWTTQNPSGPWINDPLNKTIYDGHHYFSEFDDGTYPSPYATVVADAVTRGFTAGSNPDALYTRLFTDLDLFADWGDTYGVPLVVGECNVPNDQDTTSWNALLAAYLARARTRGIGVQAWSAGEFYTPGGDKLSIYAKTTSGTPLSVQEEQAPTWEAALTDETPKTLVDAGMAVEVVGGVLTVTGALATAGSSSGAASSYQTGSVSPAVGTVLLVWVEHGGTATLPVVSGLGATWTRQGSVAYGDGTRVLSAHTAPMGSAPGSGQLTISGGAMTHAVWSVIVLTDADPVTPVVGSPASATSAAASSLQVSLAAAAAPGNRPFAGFAADDSTPTQTSPRAGWVELSETVV